MRRLSSGFSRRHDVEGSLESAARLGPGAYEEDLESLVGVAQADYEAYVLGWPEEVQEGEIRPKKRRRTRKPKDISEPSERQDALGRYLARVVSEYETVITLERTSFPGACYRKKRR